MDLWVFCQTTYLLRRSVKKKWGEGQEVDEPDSVGSYFVIKLKKVRRVFTYTNSNANWEWTKRMLSQVGTYNTLQVFFAGKGQIECSELDQLINVD